MDFNAPLRPSLLQLCDAQAIPSGATQLPGTRPGATLPNRALTWNQAQICSHAEGLYYTTSSNHVQDCPDMLKIFKHVQATVATCCRKRPQKSCVGKTWRAARRTCYGHCGLCQERSQASQRHLHNKVT